MSDSVPGADGPPRAWVFYLDDMIGFTSRILSYTHGLGQDTFAANNLVYDATLRNLELIGEAATHIPEDVRVRTAAQIPWRLIIATRNRLIHAYLGIDNDTVWSIIESDVPSLLRALRDLKDEMGADRGAE